MIHFSSLSGLLEIMKTVIEHNPEQVNATTNFGETPIMLAIVMGHIDVINFLLSLPDRKDLLNVSGQTVMHYVPLAAKNQLEIFKLLLPYFTDWNMADYQGTTPFMYMAWNGCIDLIGYIWDLPEKPDLFQRNAKEITALHFATFESFSEEANIQVLQFLIEKDANVIREKGKSILWSALNYGKVQTTKFLLTQVSKNEIKQLTSTIKEQNHLDAMEVMEEARKLLKEEKEKRKKTRTFFLK